MEGGCDKLGGAGDCYVIDIYREMTKCCPHIMHREYVGCAEVDGGERESGH